MSKKEKKKKSKRPASTGDKQVRNKLGQFLPGISGNPKGKVAGTLSLVAKLKVELENIPPELKVKGNKKDAKQFIQNVLRISKEDFDKLNANQIVQLLKSLKNNTYSQLIIRQYLKKIIFDGNERILVDLFDRVDGKPKQSIEMPGVMPTQVIINIASEEAEKAKKRIEDKKENGQ